jgi:arabinan endo-1,5-alpha-L-arabinosidase
LSTLWSVAPVAAAEPAGAGTGTYQNPLPIRTQSGAAVESCADPTVIRGVREADRPTGSPTDNRYWYMYCTKDPLNDEDRNADGFNFNPIPMFRSRDLVNWKYQGNVFSENPSWADPNAGLFAPEIAYIDGKYRLYYTVTDVAADPREDDSAIGVASSDSPLGPWTDKGSPVVEPHGADCCGPDSRRNVFDPEVLRAGGQYYMYYGSYFGGVSVRQLTPDGLTTSPATQSNVAIANKFEGAEVVKRGGYYYLMLSATDCCRGPLTGYSVFVGRSLSPRGPFLDKDGVDLNDNEGPNEADVTDARAGGTPILSMNGNRWVGTGHNTVFNDLDGQSWTIYHAIDRFDPYFEQGVDIFPGNCGVEGRPDSEQPCGDLNKRPALLDPIYWSPDGWPNVRGGRWASDKEMPAPAAQPGQESNYVARSPWNSGPGQLIANRSDEFDGDLDPEWSWIDNGQTPVTSFNNGKFIWRQQNADLFVNNNSASVLVEDAPSGDFVVDVKLRTNIPEEGCCFNFRQGGVVIYGNNDNFLKLTVTSIFNTRQTEWAKEESDVPQGYPRQGNTVIGAPADWTILRIVRTESPGGVEYYQAWTRTPGNSWTRGGTWTHRLTELDGPVRIGLVSMGAGGPISDPDADYRTFFDYVRVHRLDVRGPERLP